MDYSFRPFRTSDAEALAALTLAVIRVTDLRAYTPEQVATWAARYPGAERFIASAAKGDTILVAVDAEDAPLAFALTVPDGHCDMLYCHPDHAGRGLAAALLAETEIFARGANYLPLHQGKRTRPPGVQARRLHTAPPARLCHCPRGVIPRRIDHDPCAHWRMPMDMMRHG